MANRYVRTAALVLVGLMLTSTTSFAQRRNGGGRRDGGGSARRERAVPRSPYRSPDRRYIAPRNVRPTVIVPYQRPYYSRGYRAYGYPYGYRSYAYRPGFSLYFGVPYAGYRYPGYAYGYPAYGYGGGYGYYAAIPGRAYGSVRIVDAPRDAQVFVDGYYAGIVDDYDGVFQRLNLEIGPHRIEIEAPGYPRVAFDVRIEPGQTITYRAYPRP
jgi:hypothetical protein